MIDKQTLVAWLNSLPSDTNLALLDSCGPLVAIHDGSAIDVGDPPEGWCSVCAGTAGQHRPNCPVWRDEMLDRDRFQDRGIDDE